MISKSTVRASVLAASVLLFFSLAAYGGQQSAARSTADGTGGVVVVLEHIASGKVMTTRTDEKGNFSFSDVESGKYRLRFGCNEARREATAQAGKVECLAELRIEISDKSRGKVSGTIQKAENR